MNEMLSVDEIKARYPDEFVILGDPVTDESLEPERGVVVSHGKDKDAVCKEAGRSAYRHLSIIYTGEPNADGWTLIL